LTESRVSFPGIDVRIKILFSPKIFRQKFVKQIGVFKLKLLVVVAKKIDPNIGF
jgi:hypothetical protein